MLSSPRGTRTHSDSHLHEILAPDVGLQKVATATTKQRFTSRSEDPDHARLRAIEKGKTNIAETDSLDRNAAFGGRAFNRLTVVGAALGVEGPLGLVRAVALHPIGVPNVLGAGQLLTEHAVRPCAALHVDQRAVETVVGAVVVDSILDVSSGRASALIRNPVTSEAAILRSILPRVSDELCLVLGVLEIERVTVELRSEVGRPEVRSVHSFRLELLQVHEIDTRQDWPVTGVRARAAALRKAGSREDGEHS